MNHTMVTDGPPSIQWRDYYSVGDSSIDQQHQKVIEMINWLYEVIWQGGDRNLLPTLMRRISEYTVSHFEAEEKAMREAGFPGFATHKEIHDKLADQTRDMLFGSLQADGPDVRDVLRFLKQWWINHITGDDKEYVSYLKNARRDARNLVLVEHELSELIDALVDNEGRFRHYYEIMANCLPEFRETWETLQLQEGQHAKAMGRIRHFIEESPARFGVGKFSPQTARVMSRDIDRMIAKIDRGEVHPRYALSFARDIEQSLVESDLEEAIWTDVAEVKDILTRLNRESVGHRNLLLQVDI